jgi:hypothetical protein
VEVETESYPNEAIHRCVWSAVVFGLADGLWAGLFFRLVFLIHP